MRILAVTGTPRGARASTIFLAVSQSRGQSLRSEDPPFFETTLLTGQPKLMSMKSGAFQVTIFFAASPMRVPSAPKSWTPSGRWESVNSVYLRVRWSWRMMPSAETNSVTMASAPSSLQMWRKTMSVTPAIGARNRGGEVFWNQGSIFWAVGVAIVDAFCEKGSTFLLQGAGCGSKMRVPPEPDYSVSVCSWWDLLILNALRP